MPRKERIDSEKMEIYVPGLTERVDRLEKKLEELIALTRRSRRSGVRR